MTNTFNAALWKILSTGVPAIAAKAARMGALSRKLHDIGRKTDGKSAARQMKASILSYIMENHELIPNVVKFSKDTYEDLMPSIIKFSKDTCYEPAHHAVKFRVNYRL